MSLEKSDESLGRAARSGRFGHSPSSLHHVGSSRTIPRAAQTPDRTSGDDEHTVDQKLPPSREKASEEARGRVTTRGASLSERPSRGSDGDRHLVSGRERAGRVVVAGALPRAVAVGDAVDLVDERAPPALGGSAARAPVLVWPAVW